MIKVKKKLSQNPNVIAAYLFGSIAEGYEHKRSDIDIAVLFDETVDKFHQFDLEVKIGNELKEMLKHEVQILVLNKAPFALAFRAIRGVLIFEKNPVKRALFEARVASFYYDQKYFQDFCARVLHERGKEYASPR